MNYPNVQLFIDGKWRPAASGKTIPVINPATEEPIGTVAHAGKADLDEALAAADKGFKLWRAVSPLDRSKVMRKAADLIRERAEAIATLMTIEQGKILAEAQIETLSAADTIEWFAEEGRRTYGRLIPARVPGVYQMALQRARRRGCRVHAVEFPDQPGGQENERGACRRAARSSSRRRKRRRPRLPN